MEAAGEMNMVSKKTIDALCNRLGNIVLNKLNELLDYIFSRKFILIQVFIIALGSVALFFISFLGESEFVANLAYILSVLYLEKLIPMYGFLFFLRLIKIVLRKEELSWY